MRARSPAQRGAMMGLTRVLRAAGRTGGTLPQRIQSPRRELSRDHLGGGTWRADAPFSSVTFKVRHLGARDYRAGFRGDRRDARRRARARSSRRCRSRGWTSTTRSSASGCCPRVPRRRRFPDVRWVVSEFEGDASRAIAATGELSIHGHTRTVEASGRIGLPGPGC